MLAHRFISITAKVVKIVVRAVPCLVCTDARSQIGPFQPFRVNRIRPTSVYIRIGPTKMAYFRVHDGSNIAGDQDPFLANFPVREGARVCTADRAHIWPRGSRSGGSSRVCVDESSPPAGQLCVDDGWDVQRNFSSSVYTRMGHSAPNGVTSV